MLNDPIDFDEISTDPTIESIKTLIGEDLLEQLSADLGGAWLYIPANPGEHCPLAVSIGIVAAKKLGQAYGGYRFAVPVAVGRRATVRKMLEQDIPVTQISRRLKVSIKFVRNIRSQMNSKKQTDLFS